MEYKQLFKSESRGNTSFGIEILVAATNLPDLKLKTISEAAYAAAELVEKEVRSEIIANDPIQIQRSANEKKDLISIFTEPIFVESIPNGYCSRYCCKHLPWFIITTKVGRFTIGWRKRVINIEWIGIPNAARAEKLFPNEDVTKGDYSIHAWSLEDAKRYVKTVMENLDK